MQEDLYKDGEIMEAGKQIMIVNSDKLPQYFTSVLHHYKNGTVATVKSVIQGFVEIEISRAISTISLYGDEIQAIEVIG